MSTQRINKKVAPEKRERMILANYRKYTAQYDWNIDFVIDDTDVNKWYLRFHNMDKPFRKGEYLAELYANENPYMPPKIKFLTPNGVFKEYTLAICTTMSTYHGDTYPAVLGMGGFATNMMNGMVGHDQLESGLNILHTSDKEKQKLAYASRAHNRKHHMPIVKLFQEYMYNQPLVEFCQSLHPEDARRVRAYLDLP